MVTAMVTDTVMEMRQKSKLFCQPHKVKVLTSALAVCLCAAHVSAKELSLKPIIEVSSQLVRQEVESNEGETKQGQVLQIVPGVALGYQSNRIEFVSSIKSENIFRSSDLASESSEQHSDTLALDGLFKADLIKDIANFQIQARQYQQIVNTQNNGVLADRLINGGSFVDAFQHNASLQLQNPVPSKVRAVARFNASGRKTDKPQEQESVSLNQIDSQSLGANFQLGNGYRESFIEWQLQYATQQTNRENGGTITTENANIQTVTALYKGLGLALNATKNGFEVDGNVSLTNQLDFKQIGAGLSWKVGKGSELKVIGYEYQRGNSETESYVGGSFDWRISSRSSLQYERNANARGQTDSLSLTQNSRFLKTRATLSQGINVNSRQGFNASELGTFVCPAGATDLTSCYQPDSLTYTPAVGESVVNVDQQELELSEEVVEQTLGQLTIGYDNQSKIKATMAYTYSNQKSLEAGRQNLIRQSISTNFAYHYSTKTNLSVSFTTSESDYFEEGIKDLDTLISFNLDKQLTKKLSFVSYFSVRDRQSQRQGFDVTDYRLSAAIQYTGF